MNKSDRLKNFFRRKSSKIKFDEFDEFDETNVPASQKGEKQNKNSETVEDKKPSLIEKRREKKRTKKAKRKSRPLKIRVFIQVIKSVLIRLPLLIVVIIAAVLFSLKFYFTAPAAEGFARWIFPKISNGTLELRVEAFNIYRGFVIRDIVIRSGDDFAGNKILEIDKLVLDYGFFPIFTGSIRFSEIGIYNPKVYLTQKNGLWNFETLMKPSEEAAPESEKEKKEEESPSSEIELPIAVDFLLNFILDSLSVYVNGEDYYTELTGLSFRAGVEIPSVKVIPKSVEAVRILKAMKLELNPQNSMNVKFYSKEVSAVPELLLNWNLVFNNTAVPEFKSSLNIGAKRIPFKFKDRYLTPFNFLIAYDIFYEPISDILKINNFSFGFMNSNWLKLSGSINSVTKSQSLNIDMTESLIPLKDIYPYYAAITGDRDMKFSGDISLYPLAVRGSIANPDIKGKLSMKNVYFKIPDVELSVPYLAMDYTAAMSGDRTDVGTDINVPHFAYVLDGSKSNDNGIKIFSSVTAYENFQKIKINEVRLNFFNPGGGSAVSLNQSGEVNLGNEVKGAINISRFRVNTSVLSDMVPGRLKKQISSIPLTKPVDMKMTADFNISKEIVSAGMDLFASVPDYGADDIRLKTSASYYDKGKRATVNSFFLGSKSMNLAINADGFVELKRTPISDSNLKVSVELDNPKMKNVWGGWNTSGSFKLTSAIKGNMESGKADGKLEFKNFNLKNDEEMLAVSEMNMDFPFEYDFNRKKIFKSSIAVDQKQVIDNEQFAEKPNFTILSVKAKHPARNISYEYMNDFSARISFEDNVFSILNLKAFVMDGSVYGRSILVNLADLKLENMEFNLVLDAVNINIARLDEKNSSKTDKEAELSFNANFSGKGLNIKKELTSNGYVNIYKIGTQFANRLMKGLSEEKGKSKLGVPVQFAVDNSMIIKGFDFRLDKGLVYTTVTFTRRVLSLVITVDNNQVVFDRIPVQEYLRKVSEAQ